MNLINNKRHFIRHLNFKQVLLKKQNMAKLILLCVVSLIFISMELAKVEGLEVAKGSRYSPSRSSYSSSGSSKKSSSFSSKSKSMFSKMKTKLKNKFSKSSNKKKSSYSRRNNHSGNILNFFDNIIKLKM